ncbi:MAG: hypothetical protein ABI629_15995 [bacterium]
MKIRVSGDPRYAAHDEFSASNGNKLEELTRVSALAPLHTRKAQRPVPVVSNGTRRAAHICHTTDLRKGKRMTILDLLEHDHQRLEGLVAQTRAFDALQPMPKATDELERALGHLHNDHAVLFEALASWPELNAAQAQTERDERQLNLLIRRLHVDTDSVGSVDRSVLAEIDAVLRDHVVREQDAVLSPAAALLDAGSLESLFDEAQRRKYHQSVTDHLIFPAHRFGIE